jgi:hypothetical protein
MAKIISLSALSAINPNDLFYVSTSLSADRKATAAVLLSFVTQNLSSLSANNASVYSTVSAQSANNVSVYSSVNAQSANNASVFSTVNTNSATNWNYQGNDVKALTGNWQNTYTRFSAQSANNASVFSTVQSNSTTNWDYQGNDVKALTGNWQNTYTQLSAQSANNASVFNTVSTASGSWHQTLVFNPTSALLSIVNGNTVSLSSFNAQNANNASVFSTVSTNSSTNWNYQGNDVKALTGNWQNTYATVSSTSGSWLQTLSFNSGNAQLSISGGNTISLSSLSSSGGLPTGGTTNQILVKNSATNNDASWKNKRITLTLPTLLTTGTLSSNALSADQFVVSLGGASTSATIGAPISAYDSQIIMWNIRYSSNIAAVLLAASFRTPATTLNWSVSTNKMDIMAAKFNLLDSKWDVISFAPGYQL